MLRIQVLGPLRAELDGQPVRLPDRNQRVCALLAWLAVHPGPHHRSTVAAELWPDAPAANARASLRSAIWSLRTALGPAAPSLTTARETIALSPEVQVDLTEFDRLASAGATAAALSLCRGELLTGWQEDWLPPIRADHARRLARVLALAATAAETEGDHTAALTWARRRADLDPVDEVAARELIRLLAATGDHDAALSSYARLRRTLQSELDVAPAPETVALIHRIRSAEPLAGFESVVPPSRPAEPVAGFDSVGQRSQWAVHSAELPGEIEAPVGRVRNAGPPATGGWLGRAPVSLIGRVSELAQLRNCLARMDIGRGCVVMINGEGGIGKTALAEELLDLVGRRGIRSGSGAAGGPGGMPFGVWSEALAEVLAGAEPLPADATWVADLARLVPAVAPRGSAGAPEHDRIRLFEAVVQLLVRLSARGPLVLVLEDLHLADASSLDLLGYVGRRIGRLPVLLVLTRRRLPPGRRADAVLAALRAKGVLAAEMDLGPLNVGEVRELARCTADLTAAQLERIVSVAGGSPLLTVTAARQFALGHADPVEDLRVATRAELGRLSGQARLFVELAAVAGHDLGRADIVRLPLLTDPDRAATEALGAGLLRIREGAIGFRHALLRAAVYDDIAEPVRAHLHEALATELSARDGRATRRAAEIADHLRRAGRDDLAVGQLIRAAADARAVAALAEAAGFLREALEIEPDHPGTLLELGEVEAWRGRLEAADDAFDRALELISPQDTGALIAAWLRRGMWLRGGVCHPRESRRSYRAALDLLEREPDSDPMIRAEVLAGLAWAESVAGEPGAVAELLEQAAVLTADGPVGDLLAHDLEVARAHALLRAGRFTESYAPLVSAADAAQRARRPDLAYSCLINAASAAACAGEFTRSVDFADRCLSLVVPNGLLRLIVYTQSGRCALLRRLDRLAEAQTALDAAAGAAERLGSADLEALVHHDRGLLAHARGENAAAAEQFRLALAADPPVSRALTRLHRAESLTRAGQLEAAEAELRAAALEPVAAGDFPDTLVARMQRIQGLIAHARRDDDLAVTRLRQSARVWRRRVTVGAPTGENYSAALVDLGRPPLAALVEPARELDRVLAELAAIEQDGNGHAELR
ncbi:AAA family ATPase [Nocardia yamanashiensis]|uniref:ATP-binding protein n=1 Tax=Nocardia yamanashiensis TaxID=209247 RepID=UPI001E4038B9|nr:AAA family ATPase [Nocardia yamanashiensis]UGT44809.1 AAA family ATPase [Nocardia yamanashiensis]